MHCAGAAAKLTPDKVRIGINGTFSLSLSLDFGLKFTDSFGSSFHVKGVFLIFADWR